MTKIQFLYECGCPIQAGLNQCACHHIYRDGKRLASVGSLLRLIPRPPCEACGARSYSEHVEGCPVYERIVNAQIRGREVEALFGAYVMGKFQPTEVREDSWELFLKLAAWFNKHNFSSVEYQTVIGDDEIGGVTDFIFDDIVYELKATYSIEDTHILQCAGYTDIRERTTGAVLQVTSRLSQPRLQWIGMSDINDFRCIKAYWKMLQSRGVKQT